MFSHALTVTGEIARHGRRDPFWTFGGGTALMLRYGHRFSTDLDIFVPGPQSLGFVSARDFMTRHPAAASRQLDERYARLEKQFDAVDSFNFHPSFGQARLTLKGALAAMLDAPPV